MSIEKVSGGNWTSCRDEGSYFSCMVSSSKNGKELFCLVCDWFLQPHIVRWKDWVRHGDYTWYDHTTHETYIFSTESAYTKLENFEAKLIPNIMEEKLIIDPKSISPQPFVIMFFIGNPYLDNNQKKVRKIEISIFKSIIIFKNQPFQLDSFDTVVFSEQREKDDTDTYKGISIIQSREEILSKSLFGKISFIIDNYSEKFINGSSLQNALLALS